MLSIKNLQLQLDDIIVFENLTINFGHQTYLLSGHLDKRKSLLLKTLANSYTKTNKSINYQNETGIIYYPKEDILYRNLSVKQNIDFFSKLFASNNNHIKALIEKFNLNDWLDRNIYDLPTEVKKIVKVVCIFLNEYGSVYLLDGIFDDLSKTNIRIIKDYIKTIKCKPIILITKNNHHELEDLSCREIYIDNKQLHFKD